jgi:hypothetical protein
MTIAPLKERKFELQSNVEFDAEHCSVGSRKLTATHRRASLLGHPVTDKLHGSA